MRKRQIRIGIVGLGVGRFHMQHYVKSSNAKLQALCDLNKELLKKTAAEFSVPQTFTDFDEFLAKADIEAVTIAVPNYLHKPMAIAALRRGLHVLCEKPMALNTAQAVEMRKEAKASGRKFMIHFNYRFRPEHQHFKRLLESGKLGDVYYATAGWRRMRNIPGLGGWFGQKKLSGGGPLIDLGVHMLDLSRWLMGCPRALTVSASTFAHIAQPLARAQHKAFDVEDLATALVRFDNGATLNLEVSWALNFEEREKIFLEMSATRGGLSSICHDYRDMTVSIYEEKNGTIVKSEPVRYPRKHIDAQAHFLDCILHDRQPSASADDGVEIMRILDAVYESAALGREVAVRR
jgi:predicted dehydrogenase